MRLKETKKFSEKIRKRSSLYLENYFPERIPPLFPCTSKAIPLYPEKTSPFGVRGNIFTVSFRFFLFYRIPLFFYLLPSFFVFLSFTVCFCILVLSGKAWYPEKASPFVFLSFTVSFRLFIFSGKVLYPEKTRPERMIPESFTPRKDSSFTPNPFFFVLPRVLGYRILPRILLFLYYPEKGYAGE